MDKIVKFKIDNFNNACNSIADEVNRKLFDGCRSWYWIGSEVGGLCDFEDTDILNVPDMILLLENEYTYEQYAEWRDANIENEKNINLNSWIMGARHEMLNNVTVSPR